VQSERFYSLTNTGPFRISEYQIFASSPGGTGGCWDVSSKASLKHDGGGDTMTIANMVKYAQNKYGCSDHQVFVVGHSSGAMLTQALGATYPDIFIAGAAYSGVPAGCFHTDKAQGPDWNSTCSGGKLDQPPEYWGQQAKAMYPVSCSRVLDQIIPTLISECSFSYVRGMYRHTRVLGRA